MSALTSAEMRDIHEEFVQTYEGAGGTRGARYPGDSMRERVLHITIHDCDVQTLPYSTPMTFRLVAKDGKWEVHTAIPPSEGLELTFTAEPIAPRQYDDLYGLA